MKKRVSSATCSSGSGIKLKRVGIGSVAVFAVGVAAVGVGFGILNESERNTSAMQDDATIISSLDSEKKVGGVIYDQDFDAKKQVYYPSTRGSSPIYRANNTFAEYYNAYDDFGEDNNILTKNQQTEGTCWLYAATSAIEYSLAKKGENLAFYGISPKHIDYQFVHANEAYKDNGVSNTYYDKWIEAVGSESGRTLGDGGNVAQLRLALSNPLSLINEEDFTRIIKSNDSRLKDINEYRDIWDMGLDGSVLTDMGNGIQAYAVKQNYDDINNEDNVDYIVTGAKELYYPDYGSGSEKTEVVNFIKGVVQEYGAAEVLTFYDENNCVDRGGWDFQTPDGSDINFTIIDRTTYDSATGIPNYVCDASTGHAMTIIGWNDNLEYRDGNDTKRGAFIIQNSWGDMAYVADDNSGDEHHVKYYMGYDSAFDIVYFDSIEAVESYDNIYSIDDYKETGLVPGNDEYVFEFTANNNEELKEISFNQNYYSSEDYDVYIGTTAAANNFVKVGAFTAYMGTTKYEFSSPVNVSGNFAIKLKKTRGNIIDEAEERKLNMLNAYTTNINEEPSADPDHKDEPTGAITWIQGQNYVIGSNRDLVVKVDYPLTSLVEVDVDGDALAADNFKVESGSTILTIYGSFLDTLDEGSHTVQLLYSDRIIDAKFTVSKTSLTDDSEEDISVPNTAGGATSPVTGGNTDSSETSIASFSYVLPIFVVAIALGYFAYKHKKRVCFDHK